MAGFAGVVLNKGLGFVYRLSGAGTGDAAARAGHAFQEVALVAAGFGEGHEFFTFFQAFGAGHLHFVVRIFFGDDVGNGAGYTAGYGEGTSVGGGVVDAARQFFDGI